MVNGSVIAYILCLEDSNIRQRAKVFATLTVPRKHLVFGEGSASMLPIAIFDFGITLIPLT
jgi:hypothetical protein